jgi:diguanylate cyclase (GGDEF)-like protein
MNLPPQWRSYVAMVLAVVLGGAFLVVAITAEGAARDRSVADRWYVHTLDVLLATAEVRQQLYRSGYIDIDANERARARTHEDVESSVVRLRHLVQDNRAQVANVTQLKSALLATGHAGVPDGNRFRAAEKAKMSLSRIEREERALLEQRRARTLLAQQHTANRRHLLFGVSGLAVALLMLTSLSANRAWRQASAATAELRRLASTDELTGIANRRYFFKAAERAISSSRRYRRPLSLAIFDIDHFKQINDRHGHPMGDEVIKAVATIAQRCIRTSDFVARIGGEEFGLLLPELTGASAIEACERLRQAIEQGVAASPIGPVQHVSVSVGVTEARDESLDAAISRADQALYAAKDGGRNRVVSRA